jgi:hypothetical protein
MKWWALLVTKLVALILLHVVLILWVNTFFPNDRMGLDLAYTFALMGVDMFVFILAYAAWIDQKYRCRTCLSRLRMPVEHGNWSHATLFAPPKLEWICPFGHGTMQQEEVQLSGARLDQWQKNDDNFWRALEDAWRKD